MKKLIRLSVLALIGLGGTATGASAGEAPSKLERNYQFDVGPRSACAGDDACAPWGPELAALRAELHPVVPMQLARLLIPDGFDVAAVRFEPEAVQSMPFQPEVAARQQPMSGATDDERLVPAYAGGIYPAAWQGEVNLQSFRGYRILNVPLYPLRVTGDGMAVYITGGRLEVDLVPATQTYAATTRGLPRDLIDVADFVDNPPATLLFAPAGDAVGYLIIAPAALLGEGLDNPLAPLIEDKTARGLKVEVAALEEVSPTKDPAEIRQFIKQKHSADGIDYLLIVGDQARFPWKKIRAGTGGSDDPVPSDQYYACLDGDFSSRATYDWACEVAVGRVGVRDKAELSSWVAKTLALQEIARDGRTQTFLHFGERLDSSTLGGWSLEYITKGRAAQPVTHGLPSTISVIEHVDGSSDSATAAGFLKLMGENDVHVVNHLGHSNGTYNLRMDAGQVSKFHFRPNFIYSQGCYPNEPEVDNFVIRAVRQPEFGPAAMIGNTRFGWYEPGRGGEGSSSLLHRNFWAMIVERGVKTIGQANEKARELVVGADSSTLMVYTALESNLIGDPELDLGIRPNE